MLVCEGERPDRSYETAPCLLVEVLSQMTAHNDRRHKYSVYTQLPSLQTYLIVSQEARHVVEYQCGEAESAKSGNGWKMRELRETGEVRVPCLGLSLTLEQIYRGVF